MQRQLKLKDFRQWLAEQGKRFVGDPSNSKDCPLCRFLESQGAKGVDMDLDSRTVDGEVYDNPPWARRFQNEAILGTRGSRMSAARALTILPR